jgi:FkbM family methyltransferase
MYWLKWGYPRRKETRSVVTSTFFDAQMQLQLPNGTDIYVLGGKTHDSEIRLARYLIHHLQEESIFIDVGAHFGYFTLLAADLVGQEGQVISFEAAPSTFKTLTQNTAHLAQVRREHKAVSDANELVTFHEFPTYYSEYNSLDTTAFDETDWHQEAQQVEVEAVALSNYLAEYQLYPNLIKIDVEGAERKVIQGLTSFLSKTASVLIVEVTQLHLAVHVAMEQDLAKLAYFPYQIISSGHTKRIESIQQLFKNSALDSDNVVFKKHK